ncbi:TetR/AcrR family transcriptional regulator [Actinoplanes couchii]|uniref:TetR family transcriptional regulator n=1 Tax=Actinoplanes couchii TaxID=403638 RepID=A0ABQ3XN32_9ACTN|nr:TetR/AcrR family transcriptional regulator [Actinoplanes couchii]MDR6317816.1 AcrR family transcriptional regulator [Actinoplanes couchii]GID59805.1 TetR family transcriptional regulator [Actinoplanes couchii]
MTDTPNLRERTRRAMRAEVSAIATRLFAEQGCDNTTVEQIAAEAGLSRTTFFRYFGTKEDVVLTWLAELGPGLAAAFTARPAGEDPWLSLRRTFDVITAINADEPEKSLAFYRMLDANPTMGPRHRDKQDGWVELLVPLMAARLHESSAARVGESNAARVGQNSAARMGENRAARVGGSGPGHPGESAESGLDPAPRALVTAALACFNAAMRSWVAGGGAGDRDELLDRAMFAVRG